MSAPITDQELQQLIRDAIAAFMDLTPEQFRDHMTELGQMREALARVRRRELGERVESGLPGYYIDQSREVHGGDPKRMIGLRFGRYMRAIGQARHAGQGYLPEQVAKDWNDPELERAFAEQRALAAGVGTAGGYLIPQDMLPEVIEMLRSQAVLFALGAQIVPMPNGSITIPKQTGASTGYWGDENTNATISEQTFAMLQLRGHKLTTVVVSSNDLLRTPSAMADSLIRNDMLRVMALAMDLAGIRGNGVSSSPKGIRYSLASTNVFGQGGTAHANIVADYLKMIRLVVAANVQLSSPAWIMSSRTQFGIAGIIDAGGGTPFLAGLTGNPPRLFGHQAGISNQIPENLGAGTNESEAFFVEMSNVMVGDQMSIEVKAFDGGAYHDGSNVISGLSQDQTVFRAISNVDIGLRHDRTGTVLTGVTIGA